jgi:hypothetical protein
MQAGQAPTDGLTVRVDRLFLADKPGAKWNAVVGASPSPLVHPTTVLWLFHDDPDTSFRFHVFPSNRAEPWQKLDEMTGPLVQSGFIVKPLTDHRSDLAVIHFERDRHAEFVGYRAQGAIATGRIPGKPWQSFYVVGIWDQMALVDVFRTSELIAAAKSVRAIPND